MARPFLTSLTLSGALALHVPPAPWTCRGARARCSQPRLVQFDERKFVEYANPDVFEGTELTVTEYPNPVLRAVGTEVTSFDEALERLCEQMFKIMYASNGVGLAAPQVGLSLQLFVYNDDPKGPLRKMRETVVVNPRIVDFFPTASIDGWTDVEVEGCLSSRSECCCGDVRRAKAIDVEYQDVRGRPKRKRLRGFEARVFQHEFDHINGVLHIDRQSAADRAKIQPYLDVLAERHGPGGALELREEVRSLAISRDLPCDLPYDLPCGTPSRAARR